MRAKQTIPDEAQALRRSMADLAALSALSATWARSDPREISDSLANILCRFLPISLAYVRVNDESGGPVLEIARTPRSVESSSQVREFARKLSPFLPGIPEKPPVIANPFGTGALRLAIIPIGFEAHSGIVVAGSTDEEFPSQMDRLLLGVAANQAAVVLQRHQAEDALRRSERELADFFDNATIGLHWVGPDGTILRANRAELTLLGYRADEYIGHNITEFHAEKEKIDHILNQLAAGEDVQEFQATMRCKDGSLKQVVVNSNVLREDGQFIHTRCFTRDVTERVQTEEALRNREQRLQGFFDQTIAGFAETDLTGQFVHVNSRFCDIVGRTSAELIKLKLQDITHPDDLDRYVGLFHTLVEGGGDGFVNEKRYVRPDGSIVWVSDSVSLIRQSGGVPTEAVIVSIDISERKRDDDTNRFLAAASAELAEISDVESTLQRVARLAVPFFADWCAVDVTTGSDSLRRVSVTHVDEAKVRLAHELHARYPPPMDASYGLTHVLRTGRSEMMAAIPDELLVEAAQDEEHLAIIRELGLKSYICVPLRSGGKTHGVVSFVSAESQRAFTDQDLRVAEDLAARAAIAIDNARLYDRLRLLWRAAATLLTATNPVAMLLELFSEIGPHLELDTYLNYMVDERGLGLRLDSSIGIADDDLHTISRLDYGQDLCGTVAKQRTPIHATYIQQSQESKLELARSMGLRSYVCNPLISNGELLGTLAFASKSREEFDTDELAFLETICRYVTVAYERLRLLEQLREADRRKDEFLATLAHELRNPLAPVSNAVQLLRLKGPDDPELRWSRDVIDRQVSHLTRLIDDLLDISRITRNKLELHLEHVELADVIRGAVETSRPLIEQFGHKLEVALPDEPVHLSADLVRLSQVFMNLLTNAAKYTDRGGSIWLTVELQGRSEARPEALVRVRDNGNGIPREQLPQLFEMFFQVDRSIGRSQGGLGIGLSLVRRLVELHGGTVEAYSEGQGRGSEFTVRLPTIDAQKLTENLPLDRSRLEPEVSSRRILVVDDNHDAATSLTTVLHHLGHEAFTAFDGLEAVKVADEQKPDVAVLDIGLPGIDGYEVAQKIRKRDWGSEVLLIALTGWGQEADKRRALEAGFDHHMTKPVDLASLRKLLSASIKQNGSASDRRTLCEDASAKP